ncbi:RloB domain-containing protein [Treponema parvum]|uniref:RloB domain-containing protein n=1 Tax=Treponema parvum TaxID=138851 RepID=A0A975EYY8_9SPIR|nr:RloB domain-containing protein [Treponema parvum]QTQ10974.1 RloB domain-containing protein [Treponema parvum]
MRERRNIKYFFAVEGETEILYFQHLKKLISAEETRIANPIIRAEKLSPSKFAKKLPLVYSCVITAVFDVEDNNTEYKARFENILKEMHAAGKSGKSIKYELGYSNIDFELWIILHKKNLFSSIGSKKQYLSYINNLFNTNFEGLKEYKEENNFSRILSQITLNDVKNAVKGAELIMKQRHAESTPLKSYGYEWFDKNPSLSIHIAVNKILCECGI